MEPAIRFANVSKRFKFSSEKNTSVLDTIISTFSRSDHRHDGTRDLWALRDLTFDVMSGECVGLVGNNGSGKSTLLKVVSGIIRPSAGRVEIRGRLSALLELGAGFHPDLTGEENIWLNASILGLSNNDITRIYRDIVDFSELGEFINMPVKHYSSGMYMRLGFSVAVHVSPDILLIDEILAVGDQSFQDKCIRRLHELNNQGVTVIFVSHTLETVRSLCTRIFWIADGEIVSEGDTNQVIAQYLASYHTMEQDDAIKLGQSTTRWGNGDVRITRVRLLDRNGAMPHQFTRGEPLTIELDYSSHKPVEKAEFGLAFFEQDGTFAGSPDKQVVETESTVTAGEGTVRCHIQSLPLNPATYSVTVTIYDPDKHIAYDHYDQATALQVQARSDSDDNRFTIRASWDLGNGERISEFSEGEEQS